MSSDCIIVHLTVCNLQKNAIACICGDVRRFSHMRRVCNFENTIICGKKYAICGFCNICDRMCDRMFSYNRYLYNCASVQRALLAPEILNESFLKCRYFTALLGLCVLVSIHYLVCIMYDCAKQTESTMYNVTDFHDRRANSLTQKKKLNLEVHGRARREAARAAIPSGKSI